ncbi:hypothetical protein PTKU64_55180 [Paraburkholderia terrae]|uniref:Cupin type-2 domain-containing protein n=1 Tax=Paraburkholderia terrae TaxID=311230 RepID=A0ABN6JPD0_9BURK|nr:hypothetical protein PTKU64_55180 [Paraburkholderia terrae]
MSFVVAPATRPNRAPCTGSEVLYLGVVSVPPGGRTRAHIYERHDTAHYMLSGDEIEFYTGEELEDRQVAHPGDYIFTPAGVPHVAVNRSPTSAPSSS